MGLVSSLAAHWLAIPSISALSFFVHCFQILGWRFCWWVGVFLPPLGDLPIYRRCLLRAPYSPLLGGSARVAKCQGVGEGWGKASLGLVRDLGLGTPKIYEVFLLKQSLTCVVLSVMLLRCYVTHLLTPDEVQDLKLHCHLTIRTQTYHDAGNWFSQLWFGISEMSLHVSVLRRLEPRRVSHLLSMPLAFKSDLVKGRMIAFPSPFVNSMRGIFPFLPQSQNLVEFLRVKVTHLHIRCLITEFYKGQSMTKHFVCFLILPLLYFSIFSVFFFLHEIAL